MMIFCSPTAVLHFARCPPGLDWKTVGLQLHLGCYLRSFWSKNKNLGWRDWCFKCEGFNGRTKHVDCTMFIICLYTLSGFYQTSHKRRSLKTFFLQESDWRWSDGSKFTFTAWGPGEPNNLGGDENCMEINLNGTKEVHCTLNRGLSKMLFFVQCFQLFSSNNVLDYYLFIIYSVFISHY